MVPRFGTRKEFHEKKGASILSEKDCPFCLREGESFLAETQYWDIFYNLYPYSGDHRHLMATPKTHRQFSYEITPEEFADLVHVHTFMREYFGTDSYFSFTRETMENRSVEHLHIHFLVGKLQGKFLRKMLELQGYPIEQDLKI